MLKINRVVVVANLLVIISVTMLAQNNTNSPYTRYGYGELADRSFGAGRAMGGIGYGMRSNKQINPLNPASYTSMDSMTFIFDFGIAGQVSWFDDGTNKQHQMNGNIEYIALQFPVHKRIAVSAGILPYSYVGYNYGQRVEQDQVSYINQYLGEGGLNELYGGVSIDIWKKRLSVGANAGFMFGKIDHSMSVTPYSSVGTAYISSRTQSIKVKDLKLDFGMQYTHPISKTEHVVLGVAFSPGKELNTTSYNIITTVDPSSSGVVEATADTTKNQTFEIPHSFGAGISYVKQNKLTLAADFLYEDWDKAQFFSEKGQFKNRIRVAGGVEFIPDHINKAIFKSARYRAGFHYSNSYLKIRDSGYNEYGASIGLGIPLIDNRSFINLSFEYVKIKPETRALIDEQYFRFTVNYTFNERWFMKFKVD